MQFRRELRSDRRHLHRSSACGGADAIAQHTGTGNEAALPIGAESPVSQGCANRGPGCTSDNQIRSHVSANSDARSVTANINDTLWTRLDRYTKSFS
jgi:hypothetical protein